MKCKHCGYETNSEKILHDHQKNCLLIQMENGINAKAPEEMEWNALKKYATTNGIDVKGKKKEDILQELKELDDAQKLQTI